MQQKIIKNINNIVPKKAMFLEDQLLLPVPVLTWYPMGLASLDFKTK